MIPKVALVGRPNVGKSALFNRIVGKRQAIVDATPGCTRDLIYAKCAWGGREFMLVDMGGYSTNPTDQPDLARAVQDLLLQAVQDAHLVVFVVDGKTSVTVEDDEAIRLVRRSGKPVLVAVNKMDNPSSDEGMYPFYRFGVGQVFPISATHGLGVADLLDEILAQLPDLPSNDNDAEEVAVTILGRPNVGKSTLLNSLLGKNRAVVAAMPGTTRDPVDIVRDWEGYRIRFVDTAGIRRSGKIESGIEKYSVMRAKETLTRSQVALCMLDATEPPHETDAHVFSLCQELGKATIILVNKWDLVAKDTATAGAYARSLRESLKFLHFAPILFVSALTGQRVIKVYPQILRVLENYRRRVPKQELEDIRVYLEMGNPPTPAKGKPIKLIRLRQTGVEPPTFQLVCTQPDQVHFSYQRMIINILYRNYDFTGTPLRLVCTR